MSSEDIRRDEAAELYNPYTDEDARSPTADAKSRIMEKIRRDMQRSDEPAMLTFDKSTSHSRYTSEGRR